MPNQELGHSSWERVGYKILHSGFHFTAFSLPFTGALLLEITSQNSNNDTLNEALQIAPTFMVTGFSIGFVLGGTTELGKIYGKRLTRGVLERIRVFKENNFISFPQVPEMTPKRSRLEDGLSWNMLKAVSQ